MAVFEVSTIIKCTVDRAFDFLIRPANISLISPPNMGLHFVSAPEEIFQGTTLEFKIQSFGQVQELIHEITELDRPTRFVEQQVKGPLKSWIHEHHFEAIAPDQVKIRDTIEFLPPGGLLGFMVTESRILDSLDEGFDLRYKKLKQLLEQD
ncbi:MAG: SRPBCC family protein [Planctomycetota bacterium]|nr:SRPBCC family protein [Planctomycetota bacterium]MDA1214134.1 SRPBCC family protein [Planctomycetota bacterium]